MLYDFDIKKWNGNKIIIYPAGKCGLKIAEALMSYDIQNFCFCDEVKVGNTIFDKKIIDPIELGEYKNSNILIATGDYFQEIYQFLLLKYGKQLYYFTAINIYQSVNRDVYDMGPDSYQDGIKRFFVEESGDIYLSSIDLVVTECCTLKCKYCSNLMQYYKMPKNSNVEEVLNAFSNLLKIIGGIGSVRILGGEPFVNQNMINEILECYKNEEKIGEFVIVTNGTVIPNQECIETMCAVKKTKVFFSNYGVLSVQLENCKKLLEQHGICYVVGKNNNIWLDFGALQHYERQNSEYQESFLKCYSRVKCNTLFDGKLYYCPRSAHGEKLGIIKNTTNEYIDLLNLPQDTVKQKNILKKFLLRETYIKACEFCNLLYSKTVLHAQEQLDKPLILKNISND